MSAFPKPFPWITTGEFLTLSDMPKRTFWRRVSAGEIETRKAGKLRLVTRRT